MKLQRHTAIRDLLVKTAVTSQDELRRKLASRGIHVTQATLSRDIRELRLLKGPEGYALPEDGGGSEGLPAIADILRNFLVEVRPVGNLLVVLTLNGTAQPVAAGIDDEEWNEVVGTIAGDNTVLVICPDAAAAGTLRRRMEGFLG